MERFSSYYNRYYSDATGEESALWLLSEIQSSIDATPYSGTVSVQPYTHSWLQPSVIARIEGSDETLKSQIVILGAHLDSTNRFPGAPAPGTDDNGSGSAVLLETFRALLESDFIPKRTIEFQWYAAEEVGLRGSGDIAEAYSQEGIQVVSMLNLDVPGYWGERREIGIMTDNVNPELTAFLRRIVEEYCEFTWTNMSCGYACSDHASFDEYDFVTGMPAAIVFNPHMHTAQDTMEHVSMEQVREFTKLSVAYAVELSQP